MRSKSASPPRRWVVASLVGGPIAGYLVGHYKLSGPSARDPVVGLPDDDDTPFDDISHVSLLRSLLVLNVVILIAYALEETVEATGVKLPLFVVCLLVAIVVTNSVPRLLPKLEWPTRSRSLALISDLSLNVFLAMSLMSMQLWALGGLGPALWSFSRPRPSRRWPISSSPCSRRLEETIRPR